MLFLVRVDFPDIYFYWFRLRSFSLSGSWYISLGVCSQDYLMLVSWPCGRLIASDTGMCVCVSYPYISLPSDKLPRPKLLFNFFFFHVAELYFLFILLKMSSFDHQSCHFTAYWKGTIADYWCSKFHYIHNIQSNFFVFALLGYMKKNLLTIINRQTYSRIPTHAGPLILRANMHPQIWFVVHFQV